ncbi:sialate O-acetylesterase [Sorangium sp. So ce321]|uniref:sialate O-acetylesterase n=1 Tax=Sorangium sp. So ce321 TaxID=3133300 RepID=UPI003F62FFF2
MKRSCIAMLAGVMSLSASAMAQPVKVFVLAGQSNMVGFGVGRDLPPELRSQPDIWYDHYNADAREGGPYASATSTDWGPLEPKGDARRYGPEITFGRAMEAAFPEHRIAIVKVAQGGTNLVDHWGRGLPPDPEVLYKSQLYHTLLGSLDSATYTGDRALRYPDEVTRLDGALARLESEGHDVEIAALVWMQGENEAGWSAAFHYGDLLRSFIAAVREDLRVPDLPVVLGRISDNLYPANGGPIAVGREANIDAVRAAQVAVAEEDPRVAWVDTDDFTPRAPDDAYHFDSAAYQVLGQRFADAYIALASGESTSSASTASGTGSTGAGGGGAGASASAGSASSTSGAGSAPSTSGAGGSASAGGASTGSAGGGSSASGAAPAGAGGTSGCGCRVAGSSGPGPGAAALALVTLLGLRRGRQRGRARGVRSS